MNQQDIIKPIEECVIMMMLTQSFFHFYFSVIIDWGNCSNDDELYFFLGWNMNRSCNLGAHENSFGLPKIQ